VISPTLGLREEPKSRIDFGRRVSPWRTESEDVFVGEICVAAATSNLCVAVLSGEDAATYDLPLGFCPGGERRFGFGSFRLVPDEILNTHNFPCLDSRSVVSLQEAAGEVSALDSEAVDYDITIRMPPRERYTIELNVKAIRKAKPRLFASDWLEG